VPNVWLQHRSSQSDERERFITNLIHSFTHFFKINDDETDWCYNGETPSKIQSKKSH